MIFRDNRGTIKDLLVGKGWSLTWITFNPEAVRGNHYHNHTTQIDLVWGKLEVISGSRHFITKLWLIKHSPTLPHAYKALKKSKMLSLCVGERVGDRYENDTIRLEKPIL